jgi:hypothetical protein
MCNIASSQEICFHLYSCKSYAQLEKEGLTPLELPTSTAELMNPDIHPILLARTMLMFAILMQLPAFSQASRLTETPRTIANRLVEAVSILVTKNEELYGTIEILQCILYESQYQKAIGSLRRAWLSGRRALLVGQMMGIHRSGTRPIETIDPNNKIDQHFLWFKIVHADRYLSLLLGFPQGTLDTSMASEAALASDALLGRLDRLQAVIASRILERNEAGLSGQNLAAATQDIDTELLRVGKTMPAKFWLQPDFSRIQKGSVEDFWETARISSQVYYYNLLNQLHLPYLLRFDGTGRHDYSKISCVNASREILARFIAYRGFNKVPACQRALDFLALMAATTLLLAHFDSHLLRRTNNFLAHQRLGDRAMMEQVLDIMDELIKLNEDVLTEQSARVLRCLLHIEDDAAEGRSYSAQSVRHSGTIPVEDEGDAQEGECGGNRVLKIAIPCFGHIRIAREGAMREESAATESCALRTQSASDEHLPKALAPAAPATSTGSGLRISAPIRTDLGQFAPLESGTLQMEALTANPSQHFIPEHSVPELPGHDDKSAQLQHYDLPGMTAGVDDWAFQGVDMALFDSLMRGASVSNINEISNGGWPP